MVANLLLSALLSGGPQMQAGADCVAPSLIGHVVEANGDWFDERYQQSIRKGSSVCSDSWLVRRSRPIDSDWLRIQPLKSQAESMTFNCREGVTCLGPLNLNRIPVTVFSDRRLDNFVTFVRRAWKEWQADQQRVRNLMHRAPNGRRLRDTVVVSRGGKIAPTALFTSKTTTPMTLEFCRVRPGEPCRDPIQPVTWPRPTDTLQLATGFFKVVMLQQGTAGYLRTEEQAYIVVVDNENQRRTLAGLFDAARAEAVRDGSEESAANLVTYLYYLGGGYPEVGRQ